VNNTDNNWMNGSNGFSRTDLTDPGATETSTSEIMLAIVYNSDNSIDIYREGSLYYSFTKGTLQNYLGGTSFAMFGRREDVAGPEFDGIINEARIYGDALTAQQIATLFELGPDLLEAPPSGTVPEPSTLVLAVLSMMGLAMPWRRRKRAGGGRS